MASPDFFIICARGDLAIAEKIAGPLQLNGHSVWWDTGDEAPEEALKNLATASNVIIIWTENSLSSAWVLAGAARTLETGKTLIQLKAPNIDINSIPLPFRDHSIFDIEGRYSISERFSDRLPLEPGDAAPPAGTSPQASMWPEPEFPPLPGAAPPAAILPGDVTASVGAPPQETGPGLLDRAAPSVGALSPETGSYGHVDFPPLPERLDRAAPPAAAPSPAGMPPEPELKCEQKPIPADATAFCPRKFRAGESELVQIIIHLKGQRGKALQLAREADTRAYFAAPSRDVGELENGDEISVQLDVRGAKVDDPPQKQVWQGETQTFGFGVTSNGQTRSVAISAVVSINGIAIGRISFSRPVARSFKLGDIFALLFQPRLSRFKHAFFSYARPDRQIVKTVAAQYEKYGISFFQDVLHLDPGERWEKRLYKEIDRCDVFVLFWSSAASNSEWVVKEAERAWRRNARTGGSRPTLRPEILEHPSPKPQQDWLREFHLDDPKFYRD
ncbi:MAG: toll/interleukin-1 receptor domain-containing protein [Rhodomicrobium sp.]